MTSEERAEKIAEKCSLNQKQAEFIAAEIREAEKEAADNALSEPHLETFWRNKAYSAGRASMREEAVKVADHHPCCAGSGCALSEEIRALKGKP